MERGIAYFSDTAYHWFHTLYVAYLPLATGTYYSVDAGHLGVSLSEWEEYHMDG